MLAITGLTVSSGTLVQQGDSWLYDPDGIGPVTFTYQVTDGVHSVTRTAHLDVFKARPIEGTDGDDILVGTDCGEEIDGAGGCDLIDAGGGADTITGGSGDDHIVAGGGNDIVHAGAGDDIVFGGSGNDQISGGDGRDRLFGEDGDDVLSGDGCDDLLDGGAGSDLLFGGSGNDGLEGGDGDDRMQGGSGRDTISGSAGDDAGFGGSGRDALSGGEGRDLLSGGADADTVEGDAGDDTVLGDPDRADDDYDGGEGRDKIDYSAATEAIEADLAAGVVTGAEIGTDTISAFEIFSAGQGDDSVQGSDEDETIEGNAGDDVIHDGAGSDCIDGGAGDDVVLAAADGDDDHFAGGEGVDKISFAASTSAVQIDLVKKTATGIEIGTDTIRGFEKIEGGSGDDLFIAAGKEVELTGGKGRDVFDFSAAAGESMASQVVHEILDLMVDDRIRLSRYNIFKEVVDTLEDRFEDAYGNRLDEDDMPIRIRHEQTDNARATYVEADLDRNDSYELSIRLEGHHVLFVVDNS